MHGPSASEIELSPDDLEEVVAADEPASFLQAAAQARSATTLTGTHRVVVPPAERASVRLPAPTALLPDGVKWAARDGEGPLVSLLRARAITADLREDVVSRLRALLELAYGHLDEGRPADAFREAQNAARTTAHGPAAHALLRMLEGKRDRKDEQLAHVEHLVAHGAPHLRADFLAEKGRILEAKNGPSTASAQAFGEALELDAEHAGALYGREASLFANGQWAELEAHLGKLAELASPQAAAWLHVERALLLDRRMGKADEARAAMDQALALDPGTGPVRSAAIDHAFRHRDDARAALLLEGEADLESDPVRAARLELDAALSWMHAKDPARAEHLLSRAHARAPSSAVVDARVAAELVRVLSAAGKHKEALRVRKSVLAHAASDGAELFALRALAATAELAGQPDEALAALERARVLEGEDSTLLADLDRLLLTSGQHQARSAMWLRESARVEGDGRKARALLVAAEAAAAAGKSADAAKHLHSAWVIQPGGPGIFDAMAERLASSKDTPAAKAAAERVALYEQALRAVPAGEIARRVYYLERIAWLQADVADDAEAAARAYEEVLRLDPKRTSAIMGLGAAAARAGDAQKLAQALLAEAQVVEDPEGREELRLRAAEVWAGTEPERALILAEELKDDWRVGTRAWELITTIHARAERWELCARALATRRKAATDDRARVALTLAESTILTARLGAAGRAIEALAEAAQATTDPAHGQVLQQALVAALETSGDRPALLAAVVKFAESASVRSVRVEYFLRAAELTSREEGRDAEAVKWLQRAQDALPDEAIVAERLDRLGARGPIPDTFSTPLTKAVRSLHTAGKAPRPDSVLAGAPGFPELRVAEQLARAAGSAPQLANALALQVPLTSGVMARRAVSGLANLFAWVLPESEDTEPWEQLLALGSRDAVVLDTLIHRSRAAVRAGDAGALQNTVEATRRRLETASDETERIMLLVELGRLAQRRGDLAEAGTRFAEALTKDPTSVAASVLLLGVANETADRPRAIAAATGLAEVVVDPRARAALLSDAADLCVQERDPARGVALLERAIDAAPDSLVVAARLADLQTTRGAFKELGRALERALRNAKDPASIVPIAAELSGIARTRLGDTQLAIEALERGRGVAKDHVPTLFSLAELYIGERAWDKTLEALADVVRHSKETSEQVIAHVGRASILGRALEQPEAAEKELRAALEKESHDLRALRGILKLPKGPTGEERATLLARLATQESGRPERQAALVELASVRKGLGDEAGSEGALVEAAALSLSADLLERLSSAIGADAPKKARVLAKAMARARELGTPANAAWAVALADLDLATGRPDQGIEWLEEARRMDPARIETHFALARAKAGRGDHEAAVAVLSPLLEGPPRPLDVAFVRLLEENLAKGGRPHQAWVARELRGLGGDLDETEAAAMRVRRFPGISAGEPIAARGVRSFVMPGGMGRHALWDAAAVTLGIGGKLHKLGLSELGASSRDRVKPKALHPLRPLFDQLLRILGLTEVELAVSDRVSGAAIALEGEPWLVVPAALAEWPEGHAVATMARPLVRLALGVPWLGVVDPHEVLALLVALARQVSPNFTATPRERIEPMVPEYDAAARRAVDRKRRRSLEEIGAALDRAPAIDVAVFTDAMLRTEARSAFLLSGDLRASLDAVAQTDPFLVEALRIPGPHAVAAVLGHGIARDLVAFAISHEATRLRRNLGTCA